MSGLYVLAGAALGMGFARVSGAEPWWGFVIAAGVIVAIVAATQEFVQRKEGRS